MSRKKEISMFSSDDLYIMNLQFTAKYGIALHDTALTIEERRIKTLIAKKYEKPKMQKEEYRRICEFTKEYIYRQGKEFALLTYLAMEKKNNWGLMGDQRISIAFCRKILNISNFREVTQFDANRFTSILKEADKRHGNKSGDEYRDYLRQYQFELFGKKYCHDELRSLNNVLYLMEVDYYFFRYSDNNYGSEFIFGEINKLEHGNDKAFIIEKEYIRSPQFNLSCAGRTYNNTMLIRTEACEVILFNKWQKFYSQPIYEYKRALAHVNSSIREGFKAKALEYYGAKNTTDVYQISGLFINDMKLGVIVHEVAHHIVNGDMDPIHNAFRTNFYEEDVIGRALEEALADWAPEKDNRKGPIAYFCELAKKDIRNGTGNIYVNLSDNWFVDEDEEFLCIHSNVLVGLIYLFINSDGSVDFERIERDNKKIYDFLQEQFKILCEKSIDIIHNAIFDLGNRIIDYKALENEIHEFYQYGKYGVSLEKLYEYSSFWSETYLYLKKYSKEGWDKYQKMLTEQSNLVEKLILNMADSDNKKNYKSVRDYIVERSKEIGVIKEPHEIIYKPDEFKKKLHVNLIT
ncbi:hypothetical protein [Treponema sp. R80B11-R83G3]